MVISGTSHTSVSGNANWVRPKNEVTTSVSWTVWPSTGCSFGLNTNMPSELDGSPSTSSGSSWTK